MHPLTRLLPLALAAGSLHAAPLVQSQTLDAQVLLPVDKISVSDTSADGAAPVLSQNLAPGFAAFDPTLGVLTGAQGRLVVDAGHGLMAYRTESGGSWDSVARVRATWSLGSQVLGTGVLNQATSNRDTLVVTSTAWNELGATASSLGAFVGTGPLAMTLNTAISAYINDGGGGSVAIAAVLDTRSGTGGPDLDGLTGALQWQYSYLRHAQVSFDAGSAVDALALDLSGGGAGFRLQALGDATHTGADLAGWTCSGDCGAFTLGLSGIDGLQAGSGVDGSVAWLGGAPATAQYLLTLRDDDAVGAAASRATQTLVLQVSAVPEPETWAMLLAGLGWVGTRRKRR